MKLPLQYQITEYDCAVASLVNVINYLYHREEIIPEIIKIIYEHTLDGYDGKIENIGLGTSRMAMKKISDSLNIVSIKNNFSLVSEYYEKEKVTLDIIRKTIKANGVVVIRTFEEYEHYVVITDIDEDNVYIFNSYYEESTIDSEDIKYIKVKPYQYNCMVSIKRLISTNKDDFAFGPIDGREAISFYKK